MNLLLERVAFTIFGMDIYWYAVLITTGMILGLAVAGFLLSKRGFKADIVLDLALWILPLAIIGARLYYVVFAWDSSWTFGQIFQIRDGGLAIYGGVIFGAIGAVLFAIKNKYGIKKILSLLDCLVVGLILGQAIGRWGNYFNMEAFGNPITNPSFQFFPIAVNINGVWHMATFFYEFVWNSIVFVALFVLNLKIKKIRGIVFCSYFILYGVGRFYIEGLRTDSLYVFKELFGEVIRVSQMLSLLFVVGGVALVAYLWRSKKSIEETVSIESNIESSLIQDNCSQDTVIKNDIVEVNDLKLAEKDDSVKKHTDADACIKGNCSSEKIDK